MPQFNAYPAMRAQTFDLPAIMEQAQRLKGMRTQNRLREFQMQSAQAEQHRGAQLREIMPGVGAEAGLGPKSQEALGLGADLGELMKIPKAQRDQAKQQVEMIADLLMPVANARSPLEQQQAYTMARQQAQQAGLPLDKAPPTVDMKWVHSTIAQAGKFKEMLAMAEAATPPGYRRAEGGLESIPGGPADPKQARRLAEAKREGGEESAFGKGMEGQAYNTLLEYKSYMDAGQTPPADLVNRARTAKHILGKRRFFRDPEGNLLSYTPGIPQGFPTPGSSAQGQVSQSSQEGGPAPTGDLQEVISAKPAVDVRKPLATMKKIVGLLNKAKKSGRTITGIVGTGKRLGGGLGRQVLGDELAGAIGLGDTAAKDLHRLFQTLQGQMGPIILNEKRLSETERQRLMDIVGGVVPESDEKDVRSGLADLYDFIMQYGE